MNCSKNIAVFVLKRIRKYYGKKKKTTLPKKKKKNTKHFLKMKRVFLLLKNLHVIKLSVVNDLMVWEETSITEKIIKLFPNENIVINEKFNNRKPDIWFKNQNLTIEIDEGNHENYDWDYEKEREDMFKKHDFKIFWCNPNDPNFDLFKFLGEIILYISKLRKENAVNGVINKITEDFEKIVAVTKSKELKRYAKNILPNYKKWKTHNQK